MDDERAARSKDDDGRAKLYADIAHPINSACREMIQQRVIQAYQEELARSSSRAMCRSTTTLTTNPLGVAADSASGPDGSGARGPRGLAVRTVRPPPRRSAVTAAETRVSDSFGAGIFE